jgi:hypothetical protein
MLHRLVAATLVSLVAFGCSRQKAEELKEKAPELADALAEPAPPTASGGGPTTALSRAAGRDEIAHARCQHLQTCSAIAKGKTYDDLDACFVHEAAKVDDDLHADKCAAIDPSRLSSCLTTLKEKKCDAFFTSWPDACERDALCK